jgi:hypothetical protein
MKFRMSVILLAVAGFGVGGNAPAHAIGCLSGGVAGAVAGHMAHHGVLGAIGGCVAGHEFNKHQKEQALRQQTGGSAQPPSMQDMQPHGSTGQNE